MFFWMCVVWGFGDLVVLGFGDFGILYVFGFCGFAVLDLWGFGCVLYGF